jgi:hypothetical protein
LVYDQIDSIFVFPLYFFILLLYPVLYHGPPHSLCENF